MFFDWWKPCKPPWLTNWNSMVPLPKRKIYAYSFLYNPRLNWSIQLCKWFHCGCFFPFWNIFVLQSGEMIVGPSKALFMDEISTGLDSSTTFQIVSCLQQLAHISESTILVSLLQPAPETYELFDEIILMAEGRIVYHGSKSCIMSFFESCGFKCPERKGAADFLQEVLKTF